MDFNLIKLELILKDNYLYQIIHNDTDKEIRFWENNNSWGSGNVEIVIKANNIKTIMTQKQKIFTRNGPSYITIDSHTTFEYDLNINSDNWKFDSVFNIFDYEEIQIFSKMTIENTKEAREFGVFVGKLKSNVIKINYKKDPFYKVISKI